MTSQHLANFYLSWFDRFVKERLRPRGYVRYIDDLVLWHDDREELTSALHRCCRYLSETLGLAVKPSSLQRSVGGLTFLGCRIFRTHVLLSRRSKRRWQRRVRLLERAARLGLLSERELRVRLEVATAFATGACVQRWRFRRAALQERMVGSP